MTGTFHKTNTPAQVVQQMACWVYLQAKHKYKMATTTQIRILLVARHLLDSVKTLSKNVYSLRGNLKCCCIY